MRRPTGPKKGADLPTSHPSSDYFCLSNNFQVMDQPHPGGLCDSEYGQPFEKMGRGKAQPLKEWIATAHDKNGWNQLGPRW